MSTAKQFERLIDLIINEDVAKAEALFHDIVVEKSRQIYESLVEDNTDGIIDEISAEEEGGDGMMEDDEEFAGDEEIDGDYDVDGEDEFDDEDDMGIDGEIEMGGDDLESDQEDGELEDRVVNLEDKLDELMAEFEEKMSGGEEDFGDEDEFGGEEDFGDEDEFGGEDEDEFGGEEENEFGDEEVMEAIELKKVAGLYGSNISKDYADGSKKGPVTANSGQKGMASRPVKFSGDTETVPTSPKEPTNYGAKGKSQVKDAGNWNNRPNANPTVARTGKGDTVAATGKKQGQEVGKGGSVKQDNKSVIESRRTTKRRI